MIGKKQRYDLERRNLSFQTKSISPASCRHVSSADIYERHRAVVLL